MYTFIRNDQSEQKLSCLINKYYELLNTYTDLITKIEKTKGKSYYSEETHSFYLTLKRNVIQSLLKFLSLKETKDISPLQHDEFREIFTLTNDRDILDLLNTCFQENKSTHDATLKKQNVKSKVTNCEINYRIMAIMNAASKYPFIVESSTKIDIENEHEVSNKESYEQFANAILAP